MKRLFVAAMVLYLAAPVGLAQTPWPQTLTTPDGSVIRLYQPQPDSLAGNALWYHAAFSLLEYGRTLPIFGSYQAGATVETDRDERLVAMDTVTVERIDLPGIDPAALRRLKPFLSTGISGLGVVLSLDELLASLDMQTAGPNLSRNLNNRPPKIIYADKPSILVFIDGEPRVRLNQQLGMEAVMNTPYTILKHGNSWYLHGGRHWYAGLSPTGPFSYAPTIPPDMAAVQAAVDRADSASLPHSDSAREGSDVVADILVSTVPAELIQTTGDAQYVPIAGTGLLYVSNTNNDIFVDTKLQCYFLLISGRWYKGPGLQDGWEYVAADSLPADFARIPEGSAKDNVLASVAGTAEAREAVVDAQIPQTAAVDRKTATTKVEYDGEPRFATIRGTQLQYAVNTPATVLLYRHRYYCVDNGVWFVADGPAGPWVVADARPADVDGIPPDYPVYACKYVYVFGVTPDYVYMGYTPGYLGNFICGPTVVYGTGYYYDPWWGGVYFARPWTWGFNIWYDPWYGWSLGYAFGPDWFNIGVGSGWGFWTGGWWGPWIYRPPYVWHHYRGHGLYDRNVQRLASVDHRNNLYGLRHDLAPGARGESVFSDREGMVYRKTTAGTWQRRDGDRWTDLDDRSTRTIGDLNRQEQQRARGVMRIQNFQQLRGGAAGRPMNPVARPAGAVMPPANPVTRPANPIARPVRPIVRPANPVIRPAVPQARPTNPVGRPANPVTRPANPVRRPVSPATRPAKPTTGGGNARPRKP
ncbi:MAG TPA: hypothetical protein VHE54_02565 [Puia sp.]|nr:hypothetical protein [Puia sp.]